MKYVWKDYIPSEMKWVEEWLDEAAVGSTGLEEGWQAFYEYWKDNEEENCILGQNYWCKTAGNSKGAFGIIAFSMWEGSVTVMEMLLAPGCRGQGLGTAMLKELLQEGKTIFGREIQKAEAVIFPDNTASRKAFQKAGFVLDHASEEGDALYYVFSK